MNIFKKFYCRVFQGCFRLVLPILPYGEPIIKDSVLQIKDVLKENNIDNALIVTDKSLRALKLTEELEKDLSEAGIKFAIYDDVIPNPTIENIENGKVVYESNACAAIIAFGGGSVMECAKMIGARVSNQGKTVAQMKGLLKVKHKLPLLIAIPTTAGTGSETTLTAVITDGVTHHKYTINDFNLIPKYAVLDKALTLNLPPHLTATTGMDALTHAIEAFIGRSTTKFTRRCALDACRLIFENLPKVYENGKNEDARRAMLKASYLAGLAFSRSYVGYIHAVAHSLGGKYGTAHGLANAVIMPHVLELYGKKCEKKLKIIADYCGLSCQGDNESTSAKKVIDKIKELNAKFGIPHEFDFIQVEDIEEMSKHADKEANPLYPVPVLMDAKELETIYYKVKGNN